MINDRKTTFLRSYYFHYTFSLYTHHYLHVTFFTNSDPGSNADPGIRGSLFKNECMVFIHMVLFVSTNTFLNKVHDRKYILDLPSLLRTQDFLMEI